IEKPLVECLGFDGQVQPGIGRAGFPGIEHDSSSGLAEGERQGLKLRIEIHPCGLLIFRIPALRFDFAQDELPGQSPEVSSSIGNRQSVLSPPNRQRRFPFNAPLPERDALVVCSVDPGNENQIAALLLHWLFIAGQPVPCSQWELPRLDRHTNGKRLVVDHLQNRLRFCPKRGEAAECSQGEQLVRKAHLTSWMPRGALPFKLYFCASRAASRKA